ETIELVEIQKIEDLVDWNIANHTRTPERRRRQWGIRRDVAALTTGVADSDVLAHCRPQEDVVPGIVEILDDEQPALLGILENIHCLESLERILTVEHARIVRALAFDKERAPPEPAIDRGASDQDGNLHSALVELLDAKWH